MHHFVPVNTSSWKFKLRELCVDCDLEKNAHKHMHGHNKSDNSNENEENNCNASDEDNKDDNNDDKDDSDDHDDNDANDDNNDSDSGDHDNDEENSYHEDNKDEDEENDDDGDTYTEIQVEMEDSIVKYIKYNPGLFGNGFEFYPVIENINDVTPNSIYDRCLSVPTATDFESSDSDKLRWRHYISHDFESLLDCHYTSYIAEKIQKNQVEFQLDNIQSLQSLQSLHLDQSGEEGIEDKNDKNDRNERNDRNNINNINNTNDNEDVERTADGGSIISNENANEINETDGKMSTIGVAAENQTKLKDDDGRITIYPKMFDMNEDIDEKSFEQEIKFLIRPPWINDGLWYYAYYILVEESFEIKSEKFSQEDLEYYNQHRTNFYLAQNQRILVENAPMTLKFGNKPSVRFKFVVKWLYSILFLFAVLYAYYEIIDYMIDNFSNDYTGWDKYNCYTLIIIFSPNFKRALVSTFLGELITIYALSSMNAISREKSMAMFPLLKYGVYLLWIINLLIIPIFVTHMIGILIIYGISLIISCCCACCCSCCCFCCIWVCIYQCYSCIKRCICGTSNNSDSSSDTTNHDQPADEHKHKHVADAAQFAQVLAIENQLAKYAARKDRLQSTYADTSKLNVVNDYFGIKVFKQHMEKKMMNEDDDGDDGKVVSSPPRVAPGKLKRSQSTRFDDLFYQEIAQQNDTTLTELCMCILLVLTYLIVLIILPAYIRWIYGNDFWESLDITLTERRTTTYFQEYLNQFKLYISFFTWFF